MKRFSQFALIVIAFACSGRTQTATVVDRVIAVVNNTPVLQSDWETMLRFEALMNGRAAESFTEEERQGVFGRLVDQELIRHQMKGVVAPVISDADVDARLKEVRAQIANASKDDSWKEQLRRFGISDGEVRVRLRSQIEILRYMDEQFRPLARVDYRSVTRYYRDQYLPELKKRGAAEVPLTQVADKIREILVQQRIDEQINAWLQTLREGAEIRIPQPFSEARVETSEKQ